MKACVLLSGCGVFDGSEIHESVLSLLALDEQDIAYDIFSLETDQTEVVAHASQETKEDETRNCLIESARIARGPVKPLAELQIDAYSLLLIPGGFGVAKNFCDFAYKGPGLTVQPEIRSVLKAFHTAQKPIVCLCIAPILLAKCFPGCTVTMGESADMTEVVASLGSTNSLCNSQNIVYDESFKFITTPAYMNDVSIKDIKVGIHKAIEKAAQLSRVPA
tara:strand:- start:867 stop:1526 length:660 start_codon:yes stop_codon:yes gene_type:complete